jgi:hypothetical protein
MTRRDSTQYSIVIPAHAEQIGYGRASEAAKKAEVSFKKLLQFTMAGAASGNHDALTFAAGLPPSCGGLSDLFGMSPTLGLECRQARRHEGEIICLGNQNAQIEQDEQSFPRVPRRHGDCSLATINHGRSEAAIGSPLLCFGSDVI